MPHHHRRQTRRLGMECLEDRLAPAVVGPQAALATPPDPIVPFSSSEAGLSPGTLSADFASLRDRYGLDGTGQTVVVIDTGVAADHLALQRSGTTVVVGGYDFSGTGDPDFDDDPPNGSHGTHVAGILASQDQQAPGLVPGVDLIALRVVEASGRASITNVEEALSWVHLHRNDFRFPVTTVNISLGLEQNASAASSTAPFEDELALLEADGIVVVAAAGNSFLTYQTPGLNYPASSSVVIAAMSSDGRGNLSYYSQRSTTAIAAPGQSVLSTVPDYLGNSNGIDDDFVRFSGTSMAAPAISAAAVVVRQASEQAGRSPTPEDIRDILFATADPLYDPITQATYKRLNVVRAVESILPADAFGDTPEAAGSLDQFLAPSADGLAGQWNGTLGKGDRDYFSWTPPGRGRLEVAVGGDLPGAEWLLPDGRRLAADTQTWTIATAENTPISFALVAADGVAPGAYRIQMKWTPAPPEPVGSYRQESVTAIGRQTTLPVAATLDGQLTVEARFDASDGDVDLEVFDTAGNRVGGSYGLTGVERVDFLASAGETYTVQLITVGNTPVPVRLITANVLRRDGDQVVVVGTSETDTIRIDAADLPADGSLGLQIGDLSYRLVPANGSPNWNVTIDSGGGNDRLELVGSAAQDFVDLERGKARWTSDGLTLRAEGFFFQSVVGGGGDDVASLFDTPGDDHYTARPFAASMTPREGNEYRIDVTDFRYIHAYKTAGGVDVAELFDSPGDDRFIAKPTYGRLFSDDYVVRAKFFDYVHAYAGEGNDTATLYAAAAASVEWYPVFTKVTDVTGLRRAKYFDAVHVKRAKESPTLQAAALPLSETLRTHPSNRE
ncbi:MAG: hypothetical protein D6741_11075 [Planctomycetota bacterium]|nr:MAG: hypothetical protein D6741_11075 [Planctomycetota bacterium]